MDRLLNAFEAIIPDLERFVSRQGPGPDVRLAEAKAAIAEAKRGVDDGEEVRICICEKLCKDDECNKIWHHEACPALPFQLAKLEKAENEAVWPSS